MDKSEVVIFHDFNGRIYFAFLERRFKVYYCVNKPFRTLLIGLYRLEQSKIQLALYTFYYLLIKIKSKKCPIIFASAPGQFTLLLALYLKYFGRVVYHTSWPYKADNMFYYSKSKILNKYWIIAINKWFNEVVVVTEGAGDNLMQNLGVKPKVIGHAMRLGIRENHNQDMNKIRLIFIGRLVEQKGVELIYNLSRKTDASSCEIIVVGRQTEFSSAFPWPLNVKMKGWLGSNQIELLLQSSHYLIQPSLARDDWEELFGLSIIEGMAFGVVPIATNHIGPRSILDGLECGFLFDESEFVDGTIELLKNIEYEDWKRLSINAKEASKRYSVENTLNEWERVLHY